MKKISAFSFLFSIFLMSSAQDSLIVNLEEAVAYGLKNANKIKLANLTMEDAQKQVKETLAVGLPQVNGTVSFNDNLVIPTQVIPNFAGTDPEFIEAQFGTKYNTTAGLSASQLIFDGSYIVGVQASKAFLALTEFQKNESEFDVKQAIKQSYYAVLVGKKNIELLDSNYANTKQLAYEIQRTFESGLVSETDADQITLNLKRIESLINTSIVQLTLSENLLKYEMGIPYATKLVYKDSIEGMMTDDLMFNAIEQNYDVQNNNLFLLSEQNSNMQALNIKYEKTFALPSLNAFFSQQYNGFGTEFSQLGNFNDNWFPATVWGVQLNVPIFSGLKRVNKVQRAKIGYEKALIEQQDVERALDLQLNQAETKYNIARNTFEIALENKKLADKIYNKTTIKFKEGVASSLDYSQVERQQVDAQQELMRSVYEVLVAKTELDKIYNK